MIHATAQPFEAGQRFHSLFADRIDLEAAFIASSDNSIRSGAVGRIRSRHGVKAKVVATLARSDTSACALGLLCVEVKIRQPIEMGLCLVWERRIWAPSRLSKLRMQRRPA